MSEIKNDTYDIPKQGGQDIVNYLTDAKNKIENSDLDTNLKSKTTSEISEAKKLYQEVIADQEADECLKELNEDEEKEYTEKKDDKPKVTKYGEKNKIKSNQEIEEKIQKLEKVAEVFGAMVISGILIGAVAATGNPVVAAVFGGLAIISAITIGGIRLAQFIMRKRLEKGKYDEQEVKSHLEKTMAKEAEKIEKKMEKIEDMQERYYIRENRAERVQERGLGTFEWMNENIKTIGGSLALSGAVALLMPQMGAVALSIGLSVVVVPALIGGIVLLTGKIIELRANILGKRIDRLKNKYPKPGAEPKDYRETELKINYIASKGATEFPVEQTQYDNKLEIKTESSLNNNMPNVQETMNKFRNEENPVPGKLGSKSVNQVPQADNSNPDKLQTKNISNVNVQETMNKFRNVENPVPGKLGSKSVNQISTADNSNPEQLQKKDISNVSVQETMNQFRNEENPVPEKLEPREQKQIEKKAKQENSTNMQSKSNTKIDIDPDREQQENQIDQDVAISRKRPDENNEEDGNNTSSSIALETKNQYNIPEGTEMNPYEKTVAPAKLGFYKVTKVAEDTAESEYTLPFPVEGNLPFEVRTSPEGPYTKIEKDDQKYYFSLGNNNPEYIYGNENSAYLIYNNEVRKIEKRNGDIYLLSLSAGDNSEIMVDSKYMKKDFLVCTTSTHIITFNKANNKCVPISSIYPEVKYIKEVKFVENPQTGLVELTFKSDTQSQKDYKLTIIPETLEISKPIEK